MSVEFRPMRSVIYVDVCREEYRHRLQHWLYGHHIQDSISNFGPYVTKYAFYNALPVSEYTEINSVADGAIPDVAVGSIGSAEVYAFYRAGILDGALADGSFLPESGIKRSEVAAIIVRMFDSAERKSFSLG